MAPRDAAAVHLTGEPVPTFAVGDRVLIKRNLDHPAWMNQLPADPRDHGTRWVRDPKVDEEIGEGVIVNAERRLYGVELRVTNGFYYDARTGLQIGSKATFITKLDDREAS